MIVSENTRVIQYGLGPIGSAVARHVVERAGLELVGGVDIAPDKVGKDVGEAIGLGMAFAVRFSEKKKKLSAIESERIFSLFDKMKLPLDSVFDKTKALAAIKKDKKREADHIHFVFLRNIGTPEVVKISFNELEDSVLDLC